MRINETAALMLILGSFCPLTLFVLFWWIAGGIANYSRLPISDTAVAISAFAGLLLGIVLDVLCLRTWTAGFYDCGMAVLLALYLLMTAMSTALCMGLPCGNLVLGSGAGLYVGRRWRHAGRNRRDFAWAARGGVRPHGSGHRSDRAAVRSAGAERTRGRGWGYNDRCGMSAAHAGAGRMYVRRCRLCFPRGCGLVSIMTRDRKLGWCRR